MIKSALVPKANFVGYDSLEGSEVALLSGRSHTLALPCLKLLEGSGLGSS